MVIENLKREKKYAMKIVLSLPHLALVSRNRADKEDFFERVSGDEIIPEYSGFNLKRAREAGKLSEPKTKLMCTPFLDMLPSEPDIMKIAMLEAKKSDIADTTTVDCFYHLSAAVQSRSEYHLAESRCSPQFCATNGRNVYAE